MQLPFNTPDLLQIVFFLGSVLWFSLAVWDYVTAGRRYSPRCKAWTRVGLIFLLVAGLLTF
ncbi:MAG: hypothetical protein Q9N68_01160 [Gammaproteobacteria bacterium]|nr:hypothetical protein [Gammaproteobacteria bacterium]